MRKLISMLGLIGLVTASQLGTSIAAPGRRVPDVTKVPTITVVPGAVTTLVKRALRGKHLVTTNLPSTEIPAGSNGACSGSPSGSWDEGFGIQWQYYTNGSGISYHRATATHYCGSRSYDHNAHGTLVHGWDPNVDATWSDWNNPCDNITLHNSPEIATCASPFFDTHHGDKWLIISGQYFDQDFNGTHTWSCDGCMDTKWTVP